MKKLFNRNVLNALFALIGAAIVVFLVIKLKGSISNLDLSNMDIDYVKLAVSFLMVPFWFAIMCYVWKDILRNMGAEISLLNSMRIIGFSMLGRYIPGKLWFTLGRAYLAENIGIPKMKSFTAVVIETYYIVLTSLIFLAVLVIRIPDINIMYVWGAISAIVVVMPLMIPAVFFRIINYILKLMKKKIIEYKFAPMFIIKTIALYIVMWIFFGLQFYFLMASFYEGAWDFSAAICVYPAGWGIGFLALVLPAGLGLREGAIYFFLSRFMPENIAVIGSLASRIQMTLSEITFLFLLIGSKSIWRFNDKKKN